jgi:HD-GYP domain-containing protein (c-di-GMP phosphodiesterase class II)
MAEQIAVVITNSDLYRDLERFVINMVKSLVYAIEAKDDYTRGHSERVCRYSLLMADRMGLNEERKKVLQWSSILHDSGKIGIPESILNKPWRLEDEEYQIIKNHPKKGHTILEPLEQLASSLPGMLHHHERYDGKGYPKGLKGKQIPLEARIIAVADTFDAMTSSRAYRPAKTAEEALEEIEKVAGSQLDPELVEVFKEVFKDTQGFEEECSLDE